MLKKPVLFLLLLAPLVSLCQDITVPFNEPAFDERYHKSRLLVPVFKYTGPELEEYEKFGVVPKKDPAKFTIKKLPDMAGCIDTAYGFIYFAGAPTTLNNGYITILVGNYRRWFKPAVIFADKNNNLDFTDDGPADTFSLYNTYFDIDLPNQHDTTGHYRVRLSRFPLDKDAQYRLMLDDFYRRYQGNKVFAGADYSFKENRLNMKGATYRSETDSFRIALYDGNYDGLYDNAEYDLIYLANVSDSIFYDDYKFNFQDNLKNAEFEWGNKVYRITKLDPAGRFMTFHWDKDATASRSLRIGKKIPKFEFYLSDAKTTKKIKKYKRKGLYVYFWNTDNPNFESDTAALRQIQTRYGNCVNVVALNFGDYYKTLAVMQKYDSIPYTLGLSNRKINHSFNVETIPTGFLCRKRLKLAHANVSPQDVLLLLEKGSKK